MTSPEGENSASMGARIRRILFAPKEEWPAIAAESTSAGQIFRSWVLPLAAIGPVAALIGSLVFGHGLFGIRYRPSFGAAAVTAIIGYVGIVASVYIAALIFNWLAPAFKGTANQLAAVKLAAFSFTAAALASVFQIVPALAWLGILGFYGLYLLYLGAPVLMKVPEEKALPYTVVAVLVSVVLTFAVGALTAGVGKLLAPAPKAGSLSGKVAIPGVGSLDLSKLEETTKALEKRGRETPKASLPIDTLKALLPERIGQWERTSLSGSSAGVAGFANAQADGSYRLGDQTFRLEVMDIAVAGGFAAMAGALDIQSSEETEDGYEKTSTVSGRMTTERWSHKTHRGKYGVMVANRFMVEAEGEAPDISVLKAAVEAVGFAKLEKLAQQG